MVDYKNSNTSQALWLALGQFFTFVIAFLTAPILSRYFDKVDYGTYRQILYVYTCTQSLFLMGLPQVFPYFLPRIGIGQQKMLVRRITMLLFFIGLVFSLMLYTSADLIAGLMNNPELSVGLRIFSVFPMFTLPTMGVEGIYTSIRRTKEVAVYQVLSKLFMFLCIVLPVIIWHTGYREAIVGWGVASFLTFLVAMYMKDKPYKKVKSERIPNFYSKVFGYSIPLTGALIAGFFMHMADSFYVSRYYGTEVFAELSNGYFSVPIVGIVVGSVRGVLAPMFSGAEARGNMESTMESYRNALKKMSLIILPLLMFCFFFADDIMIALFGQKYEASAGYFRVYMLRDFIQVFPYYMVLMAMGQQKFYMKMYILVAIVTWIADYAIVSSEISPVYITVVSSMLVILFAFVAHVFLRKKLRISLIPRSIVAYISKILLHCFMLLLFLCSVRLSVFPNMNVFASIIIFGIFFYLLVIVTDKFVKLNYIVVIENVHIFNGRKKKY